MAHVTSFDHDIFISYAHVDDIPIVPGQAGWVSEFHKALDALIKQILGEEISIWRDPKLQGNDYFSDALMAALPKAAILVSILSPRYLKSEWCRKELDRFYQSMESNHAGGGFERSRIFKVVKTLIQREEQPPPLDGLLGYEFYNVDLASGRPKEYRIEFGPEVQRSYLARLYDIAYEISELIKQMRQPDALCRRGESKPTVFVAETTSDLSVERDRVKAELRQLGCTVLPDQPLPRDSERLRELVQADLERSNLAVHLIGERFGFVPEAERRSSVRIQNDISARLSAQRDLPRLIWIPPGIRPGDRRQAKFLEFLQEDAMSQQGADLLRTSLEELKTLIRDRLRRDQKPVHRGNARTAEWVRVYLVCDRADLEATRPLADYLRDQDYEVVTPVFEGDESAVREDHTEKLASSDVIIIYYGAATELWLSSKLRDLRKLPGYPGYRPKKATAVYLGPPETSPKQRLRTRQAAVLRGFGEFKPASLQSVIAAIKAS